MASVPTRLAPASLATLLLLGMAAFPASAQVFTRITAAGNPVIADALESGGSSWVDLDGDGDLDLFVPHGNLSNQNNALFLNLGGFNFRRVVTGPVVTDGGSSIGGSWGDFDRDGHLDLFVTNRNNFGNFLYRGVNDTTYLPQGGTPPVVNNANSNSASWVDIDRDGDLDLHVVNFQGDDFLFLNSGPPSWTLTRVTPAFLAGTTFSIHGMWADFDDDGDLDLFVGNAGADNDQLWINDGALNFTLRTIPDGRSTLGGSWDDFDGDGDMDLLAVNYQGQASILYRNGGAPGYALAPVGIDVFPLTAGAGVGSAWGDVDNDGDDDLFVAFDNNQNEALFLNSGPPSWTLARVTGNDLVASGGNSFGCALVDVDDDGDLDAFVANRTNQVDFLFRNDTAARHWLTLRLRGVLSSPSAEGARVRVLATIRGVSRIQTRQVLPISGYNTQTMDLHFGLDDATGVEQIEIDWPRGIHQVLTGVAADQRLEVVEDITTAVTASLATSRVIDGIVELTWLVSAAPGEAARLERRSGDSQWDAVATASVDGEHHAAFRDAGAAPGTTRDYRLLLRDEGAWTVAAAAAVEVPAAAALALRLEPAPGGGVRARLSVPEAGDVRLELIDVLGRAVGGRRLTVSAGDHMVDLEAGGGLSSGVYFARLTHARGTRTARVLLVR